MLIVLLVTCCWSQSKATQTPNSTPVFCLEKDQHWQWYTHTGSIVCEQHEASIVWNSSTRPHDLNGRIYLQRYGALVCSDLHIFCCVIFPAEVWVVQETTGEKLPPLSSHTFTKIDHHRAVVFGGFTGTLANDTYMLDMETWVRMSMSAVCTCCFFCWESRIECIILVMKG